MVPENLHDFFVAAGGVSGALIGLLFVAISVSAERIAKEGAKAQMHRIRASATLGAFTNALAISLFGLLPGQKIGWASVVVSLFQIVFITAAVLSLVRLRQIHLKTARDLVFLVGLSVIFVIQLAEGWTVAFEPANSGAVDTIAFLVVLCFLIGIARAWELIGGPDITFAHEVAQFIRKREHEPDPENAP